MKEISIVAIALSVLAHVGLAAAAEVRPHVQAVETSDKVVVLKDGTRLHLAEDLSVRSLREGVTVKLTYEERAGQHVVTRVETAE